MMKSAGQMAFDKMIQKLGAVFREHNVSSLQRDSPGKTDLELTRCCRISPDEQRTPHLT